MIAKEMKKQVENSGATKMMFDEGVRMVNEFGAENVYNFSIGNPSIPAPKEVEAAIRAILEEEDSKAIHGYSSSNSGEADVRGQVAANLNKHYGTDYGADNVVMTTGAAGGLNVLFRTLLDPGSEVVVFAPYYMEYAPYADNYSGVLKVVPPQPPAFLPDVKALEEMITDRTRIVVVNSPGNPTGMIYGEDTIKAIAQVLEKKQQELGIDIYLVADEPYRALNYTDKVIPWVPKYYDNTIVAHSYSKSLSLAGERIGYLVVPKEAADWEDITTGVTIANRIMGFVNAPSLMQKVVARCLETPADLVTYDKNRQALYKGLTEIGYECLYPDGAFYLWVKTPMADDVAFVELAKKYRILVAPGVAFGCPGYIRIAYCVDHQNLLDSIPQFKALYEEIQAKASL